jgi:hypothetical protein
MTEQRATYRAGDAEQNEPETIQRAVDLLLCVMRPEQLLALAEQCNRIGVGGEGQVRATWHRGTPMLLYSEISKLWR